MANSQPSKYFGNEAVSNNFNVGRFSTYLRQKLNRRGSFCNQKTTKTRLELINYTKPERTVPNEVANSQPPKYFGNEAVGNNFNVGRFSRYLRQKLNRRGWFCNQKTTKTRLQPINYTKPERTVPNEVANSQPPNYFGNEAVGNNFNLGRFSRYFKAKTQ